MTGRAHPGEVALEQGEPQECVDLVWGGWAVPVRVRVRMENAFALNAGRVSPMKWPCPVITGNVRSAGQKWRENENPPLRKLQIGDVGRKGGRADDD